MHGQKIKVQSAQGLTATYNTSSKKEVILYVNGLVYTGLKGLSQEHSEVVVIISEFKAIENIHKCSEDLKNRQLICFKGETLYVLGCPSGDKDDGIYAVWSIKYGAYKRKWSDIAIREGRSTLQYVKTINGSFDSPMYMPSRKEGDDNLYMIVLPKGNHCWISEKYANEYKKPEKYVSLEDEKEPFIEIASTQPEVANIGLPVNVGEQYI